MLESHTHAHGSRLFDGIVDNRAQHIPRGFTLLFYGLALWGALFMGYYLLSGWSSQAEFEASMQARQQAPATQGSAR